MKLIRKLDITYDNWDKNKEVYFLTFGRKMDNEDKWSYYIKIKSPFVKLKNYLDENFIERLGICRASYFLCFRKNPSNKISFIYNHAYFPIVNENNVAN